MAYRYVCIICGKSVATFESWKDVEPSQIVDLLAAELRFHNVNTAEMEPVLVLSRFRIVDDDDPRGRPAASGDDAGTWAGQ